MPIYEYECLKCGSRFEIMQKFNDKSPSKCSSCGGKIKKLISNTSFVLKGTGWYVTDYPSSERKKAMESKKKTDNKSDDKKPSEPKTITHKVDKQQVKTNKTKDEI